MNVMKTFFGVLATALPLALAGSANAYYYSFDIDYPGGSTGAGDVANVLAEYDPNTEYFHWSTTIDESGGNLANGFWLVVSDGPNPKNNYNEYAILYADTLNNQVTTYVYNGANSSNSWNTPGEFINSYSGVLDVTTGGGSTTIDMLIDVSVINSYTPTTPGTNDWDGVAFGNNIGIWYHPVVLTGVSYNGDGSLASWNYSSQSWYDTSNQPTSYNEGSLGIPATGTTLLIGFGLILLGLVQIRNRRRPAKAKGFNPQTSPA